MLALMRAMFIILSLASPASNPEWIDLLAAACAGQSALREARLYRKELPMTFSSVMLFGAGAFTAACCCLAL